ncbi:hypothetical protein HN873_037539, partial [Arachis hypogaea]
VGSRNISLTGNGPLGHDLRDMQNGFPFSQIHVQWQVNRNLNVDVYMQKFPCSINQMCLHAEFTCDDTNAFLKLKSIFGALYRA